MLTGKREFEGEDVADTLAAVLRGEPDWNALPAGTASHVAAIVKGCLERDRRIRIPDISAARFLIDNVAALTKPALASIDSRADINKNRSVSRMWQAAAALLALTTLAGAASSRMELAPEPRLGCSR